MRLEAMRVCCFLFSLCGVLFPLLVICGLLACFDIQYPLCPVVVNWQPSSGRPLLAPVNPIPTTSNPSSHRSAPSDITHAFPSHPSVCIISWALSAPPGGKTAGTTRRSESLLLLLLIRLAVDNILYSSSPSGGQLCKRSTSGNRAH